MRRRQPTPGRERWKPERGETLWRLDATHDSAARLCRETQRQFKQDCRTTQCEASGTYRLGPHANDGEHLQPSSGRVATAAVRPDGTDGRAAARPGRPLSCRVPSLLRGHCAPSLIQPVKP